jgi:uncharacterized membrane protein YhhN
MLNSTEKQFTILFVLLVLFELITAQVPSLQLAHYWAKPAIVFSLIVLVVHQRKILTSSLRVLLLLALSLSVSGDILLMFASQNEGFFIAGLVAFLMAHLCYLVLFFKQRHRETKPYLPLFLLYLYSVCFGYVISDSLGDLLIPVMVYEIVILLMASATFLRKNAVSRFSYIAVILGALFFCALG